jgi:hypothetical protein
MERLLNEVALEISEIALEENPFEGGEFLDKEKTSIVLKRRLLALLEAGQAMRQGWPTSDLHGWNTILDKWDAAKRTAHPKPEEPTIVAKGYFVMSEQVVKAAREFSKNPAAMARAETQDLELKELREAFTIACGLLAEGIKSQVPSNWRSSVVAWVTEGTLPILSTSASPALAEIKGLLELAEEWRKRANECHNAFADISAGILRRHADELTAALDKLVRG